MAPGVGSGEASAVEAQSAGKAAGNEDPAQGDGETLKPCPEADQETGKSTTKAESADGANPAGGAKTTDSAESAGNAKPTEEVKSTGGAEPNDSVKPTGKAKPTKEVQPTGGVKPSKMHLVDDYWTGDGATSDLASIRDNNSTAYCHRTRSSDGGLSVHAYGTAVDINPLENPEVRYTDEGLVTVPETSYSYADDRSEDIPHVITEDDAACTLFRSCGFSWGGLWKSSKNYKHFERA